MQWYFLSVGKDYAASLEKSEVLLNLMTVEYFNDGICKQKWLNYASFGL